MEMVILGIVPWVVVVFLLSIDPKRRLILGQLGVRKRYDH